MALPSIEVKVSADTASAEAGFDRVETGLDEMGRAATRANSKVSAINAPMRTVTRSSGGLGRGFQNLGYQINDFAVQVSSGQSATLALNQQLPQLLQGFGVFGVALSVIAAVGIPVVSAMRAMNTEGQDMMAIFGTLEPVIRSIGSAFGVVGQYAISAAELIVNNIDRILTIAATAAAFFAGKWVVSFIAARVATFSLAASLVALRAALIRTGIGVLIVAAGELVYQFTRLSKAAGGFGEAMSLVGQVGVEAWDVIKRGASLMGEILGGIAMQVEGAFVNAFARIIGAFSALTQTVANGMNSLFGTNLKGIGSDLAEGLQSEADYLSQGGAAIAQSASGSLSAMLGEGLPAIQKIRDLMASMKDEGITLPNLLGAGGDEDGKGGGKGGATDKLKETLSEREKAIKDHFDRIKALTNGSIGDRMDAWGSYFSNLISMTGTSNDKLLRLGRAFSAAQTLINAWEAYGQVLKDPTLPWWARIPAAGTVLAAGLGAVNAIKGGGGGAGAGGSAGAAASAGATPQGASQQPLDVRVSGLSSGQLMDGMDVGRLLERLQDEAGDRGLRITVAR